MLNTWLHRISNCNVQPANISASVELALMWVSDLFIKGTADKLGHVSDPILEIVFSTKVATAPKPTFYYNRNLQFKNIKKLIKVFSRNFL